MPKKKIISCEELPSDIEKGAEYVILQQCPNLYTHCYFKYPCKFIPEIPRWFIKKYIKEKEIIIDPFAGSGTTLLEASLNNVYSVGIEINKISGLLTKVKTTMLTSKEISVATNFIKNLNKKIPLCYPQINNIEHWFEEKNLRDLAIIKQNINTIENNNVKDFLNICFASIIRKCSKADNVSPKPYISTKINKVNTNVFDEFQKYLDKYLEKNKELKNIKYKNLSKIILGDATNFNFSEHFNGAITSPPYINAFDYVRILRLETLWLELNSEDELRNLKKSYVGTENLVIANFNEYQILNKSNLLSQYYEKIKIIDNKRAHIILKFFSDMYKNLSNVYKALKNNSVYAIVIGNSKIRGVEIESWKVINEISNHIGFTEELYFSYKIRNPYLRIDRKDMGGKINSDHILILRKNNGTK